MSADEKCPECGGAMPCCSHKANLPPFAPLAVAEMVLPTTSDAKIVMLAVRFGTFAKNVRKRPTYRPREMTLTELSAATGLPSADARAAIEVAGRLGLARVTASGEDRWIVQGVPPKSKVSMSGEPDQTPTDLSGEPDQTPTDLSGEPDQTQTQTDLSVIIATRIAERAEALGMTHRQLAQSAGVSRSALSEVLAQRSSPRISQLAKIALALKMPLEELVGAGRAQASNPRMAAADVVDIATARARRESNRDGLCAAIKLANQQREALGMPPIIESSSSIESMRKLVSQLGFLSDSVPMPLTEFAGHLVAGLACAHAHATQRPHLAKGGEATPSGALARWGDEQARHRMVAAAMAHASSGVNERRREPTQLHATKGAASHGPRR